MTTTPIQSDVLEILRALPSDGVHVFDLNIMVPNPTMSLITNDNIPTMLHRTPASDIPCVLIPRLTAGLLTARLRRSASPYAASRRLGVTRHPRMGAAGYPLVPFGYLSFIYS
jgi:hypothetical protein